MVDNMNPTSQFHPYQRETSVPVAERPPAGLEGVLNKVGIDPTSARSISDQMKSLNVNSSVNKMRSWAKANPGKLLGGLAAVALGIGLMRGRRA
jgi:hypothetical protein